jgi:hypothetical protein
MEAATADPTVPDTPPAEADIVVTGTGQLGFDIGGKRPTRGTLTITGGKFELANGQQFKKGERLSLVLEDADGDQLVRVPLLVNDVGFHDHVDSKTGDIVDCERRHRARVQK